MEGSDAASRGAPLRRACTYTDHAGYDIGTADPRAFATASPGAQQFSTRATGLRGAALFVGGGCGGSSSEQLQESPDLAGNWRGSGGLHTAAATEEAGIEEETPQGWLHNNSGGGDNCSGVLGHSRSGGSAAEAQVTAPGTQAAVAEAQAAAVTGTEVDGTAAAIGTAAVFEYYHE